MQENRQNWLNLWPWEDARGLIEEEARHFLPVSRALSTGVAEQAMWWKKALEGLF